MYNWGTTWRREKEPGKKKLIRQRLRIFQELLKDTDPWIKETK
jgi:hypothetical protein